MQMNHRYGKLRQGIKQHWLDDFITACAIDTIKNKQPDLTLIHLVDMDSIASSLWCPWLRSRPTRLLY